jgi:hypothetical protein
MAGCLSSIMVWLAATAALFWFGSGAPFETVLGVLAAGVAACFAIQSALWILGRGKHRRLAAAYASQYGALPDDVKATGTRAGGTVGRVVGGSTGYLVGGLLGAAADVYTERKKYKGMSEPQIALLHELGQLALVRPVLTSAVMVGALLGSWVLVALVDMARTLLGV